MARKTILIADDDEALAKALAIRCQGLGLDVRTSPDGLHAYQALLQQPPDLLILDVNMPGAGGLYMCEELARDGRFAPIPVIILTGQSDAATTERCRRLGAHYAWKGLDTWEKLNPMICELLQLGAEPRAAPKSADQSARRAAGGERQPCVLTIDDDLDTCRAFKVRLSAHGIRVVQAYAGMQGYWMALREQPDVVITDYRMPDGYGNHVIGKLQDHPLTKHIPIFVLTGLTIAGRKDYSLERELISLGAKRFFMKPPDFDEILRELRAFVPVRETAGAR